MHPAVLDAVKKELANIQSPYCILVVPLYSEPSKYDWVDHVLVVDVPENLQVQRVMARDGVDRHHAEAILEAQASRDERLALADDVIENVGGIESLEGKVLELHEKYLGLARRAGSRP